MTEESVPYALYSAEVGGVRKHFFNTFQKSYTIDELHDLVQMLKSYIQDEDIKEFKRLGRYDLIGLERVESWENMKNETE